MQHDNTQMAYVIEHETRRISAKEQLRLYELERQGLKPKLSQNAYVGERIGNPATFQR